MKFVDILKGKTLGSVLINVVLAIGTILILGTVYFYIYLPNTTNHGESIEVPDLMGVPIDRLAGKLDSIELRYEVGDSSYSADYPPLTVLQQFPKAGHKVKRNRKVYVSINRNHPPTLPLPNLFGDGQSGSLVNAEAILRSNELKRGRIIYQRNPNRDLLIEIRIKGKVVKPGTRVEKGSVVDLVVGDGAGPRDFVLNNLVGLRYQNALLRLGNLSLHLGGVEIPEDVDTTGVELFVFKHVPSAGDSVSIGDPVTIWIGPKGYTIKDDEHKDEGN